MKKRHIYICGVFLVIIHNNIVTLLTIQKNVILNISRENEQM